MSDCLSKKPFMILTLLFLFMASQICAKPCCCLTLICLIKLVPECCCSCESWNSGLFFFLIISSVLHQHTNPLFLVPKALSYADPVGSQRAVSRANSRQPRTSVPCGVAPDHFAIFIMTRQQGWQAIFLISSSILDSKVWSFWQAKPRRKSEGAGNGEEVRHMVSHLYQ